MNKATRSAETFFEGDENSTYRVFQRKATRQNFSSSILSVISTKDAAMQGLPRLYERDCTDKHTHPNLPCTTQYCSYHIFLNPCKVLALTCENFLLKVRRILL
jgi:hypothetical protein